MKVDIDKQHGVAYFRLARARTTRQVRLDSQRIVDYGSDGSAVGVEFLAVSAGIDLSGLPRAHEIEGEARRVGLTIRVPASAA